VRRTDCSHRGRRAAQTAGLTSRESRTGTVSPLRHLTEILRRGESALPAASGRNSDILPCRCSAAGGPLELTSIRALTVRTGRARIGTSPGLVPPRPVPPKPRTLPAGDFHLGFHRSAFPGNLSSTAIPPFWSAAGRRETARKTYRNIANPEPPQSRRTQNAFSRRRAECRSGGFYGSQSTE
jgi:hypothetical protein